MAVREGAAAAVFAGNAHRMALFEQRGVGEVFSRAPIERLFAGRHFHARRQHFFHDGVRREIGGRGEDFRAETGEVFGRIGGFDRRVYIRLAERLPFILQSGVGTRRLRAGNRIARFQALAVVVLQFFIITGGNHAFGDQTFGINLRRYRMFADFLIHHRLRCRRFIRFVMAKAAIADNINENIFLEFAQIIGG